MMLALERCKLLRGGRKVLDGVDLRVRPGDVTVLCGPNGAGKTSALLTLAGDLVPTAGRACLDGRPLSAWDVMALARRRAVLTQASELGLAFPAERVVALAGFATGGAPASDPLTELGAGELRERAYTALSGGERRLVQLARVLAQGDLAHAPEAPASLLLDEPSAQLDLAFAERVMAALRARAARGLAVLVVMHDLALAARHADHLVIIAAGRTRAAGPPSVVLDPERIHSTYGVGAHVLDAPDGRGVLVVPRA